MDKTIKSHRPSTHRSHHKRRAADDSATPIAERAEAPAQSLEALRNPQAGAAERGRAALALQRVVGNQKVDELVQPAGPSVVNVRESHGQLRRQAVAGSPAPRTDYIARKRAAPTPFSGWAGIADKRATMAAREAGGIIPIAISTEYALQQAERKQKQIEAFEQADIPAVSDNQKLPQYQQLIDLKNAYLGDIPRITVAQGAFNDFVAPGSLATKGIAQFQRIQFELGFFDDTDLEEELSGQERTALASRIDEAKMEDLNSAVAAKEQQSSGVQKQILAEGHKIQAARQRLAANLADKAGKVAEADKTKIEDRIRRVREGIETAGKVIAIVSFAATGGAAAVGGLAIGGTAALKGGLEIGGRAAPLAGLTVEDILTGAYEQELDRAKREIADAKSAEEQAIALDAEYSLTGSMLELEGKVEQLAGLMKDLAAALRDRKAYFAALGAETDRVTGHRADGRISQYLAYVSQAAESKSFISTAKSSAESGLRVIHNELLAIIQHRREPYAVDADGVWGGPNHVDPEGPDVEQLQDARDTLDKFIQSTDRQLEVINHVLASLPT